MAFDWEEYINLAESLISQSTAASNQEAYLRAAISRCYYGVFVLARKYYTVNIERQPDGWREHREVREGLKRCQFSRKIKGIGVDLERLWNDRVDADYEADAEITKGKANSALALARSLYLRVKTP